MKVTVLENAPVEINFDDVVIAHKHAPEADLTYCKKGEDKSLTLRFSADFIEEILEGKKGVDVGYSENLNMLTFKGCDSGRAIILGEKSGHGSLSFRSRIFPVQAEKVYFKHFYKHEDRYCCLFEAK